MFAISGCVLILISVGVLIGVPFSIGALLRSIKVALLGVFALFIAWVHAKASGVRKTEGKMSDE